MEIMSKEHRVTGAWQGNGAGRSSRASLWMGVAAFLILALLPPLWAQLTAWLG